MLHKRGGLALAILLALAGGASAAMEFETQIGAGSWFEIRGPTEEESDALIRLSCVNFGGIDMHIGGVFGVGKGEHEAVSLTLSAGKLTARLKGTSVWSVDSEMTGGTELLTAMRAKHDVFGVLTSGKEITFKAGGEQPERFVLNSEITAELKAFLEKCG